MREVFGVSERFKAGSVAGAIVSCVSRDWKEQVPFSSTLDRGTFNNAFDARDNVDVVVVWWSPHGRKGM